MLYRVTTAGQMTRHRGRQQQLRIAGGLDGAIWFDNSVPNRSIRRMATSGQLTHLYPGGINPMAITDRAPWFTQFPNTGIGRVTSTSPPVLAL